MAVALFLIKSLKFKPSFDEYLKALETVKIDRENSSDRSNNNIRKKKSIKKIVQEEDNGNDEDGFRREIALEVVKKKQDKNTKSLTRKKSDSRESKFLDLERAAFKSLEYEDDVFDKPRISRVDMEERIQKLAKCLNGADIDMPEWKFSEMMRSAQIRFSDHSILRTVQILGKFGNWRRVLQVIEWMQSRERFKSHRIRHIYTAALDALGKARRPVEALNLFRTMQEQMASYPDIVAYHCIAVTLGQAGHMKELFDVIDSMRSPPKKKFKTDFLEKWDPRLEPDVIVYNAVELLETTWKHLIETERIPPPLLVTEMFCTRLEQGDFTAAVSYLTNFASVESQVFSRKSWSKIFTENGHRFEEGSLHELVHEASIILTQSENLPLQHLIDSCREYLSSRRTSTDPKQTEIACKIQEVGAVF
ncbi:UNVERIFIED_CONTAM: Pentatricopeptide repeat-containing protein, chloroplastic [Sesamum radiatum]|uniref:Pentatricopeptide repeat-containing protein, chloroplastic n=1 Tax=Sesamum radiatum TaxID=300843 RepID=A0AAW2T3I8_SESRA